MSFELFTSQLALSSPAFAHYIDTKLRIEVWISTAIGARTDIAGQEVYCMLRRDFNRAPVVESAAQDGQRKYQPVRYSNSSVHVRSLSRDNKYV